MQKNVSGQKWTVFAFNRTTNVPQTGDAVQITAEISKDGAAGGGNIADTNPTELEDGYYVFDIAQGECNADLLTLLPESSTGDIQVIGVPGTVYTTEPNRNKLSVDANGRTDIIKVAGTTQSANDNGADINAILEDTGTTLENRQVTIAADVVNIDGIVPAAVGGAMNLAADAIKKVSYDESTAWPLLAADAAATQIARVGADGDTLETLSDEIAAVKAETVLIVEDTGTTLENRQVTIATDAARLTAARAGILTDWINGGRLDILLDAIKVVTDLLADSAGTIESGTVSHDNSVATTTNFWCSDITEATVDHYKGRIIIFTSGALQKQASDITAYSLDTGEGKFTVTALTEAPGDNDTFVIV